LSNARGYQQYAANNAVTASPERLVVMAYDGMVRFLGLAQEAMQNQQYEEQNAQIQRVQQILGVLQAGLNPEYQPEFCQSLSSLYDYFMLRLTEANVAGDLKILEDIRARIADLRNAWAQAEVNVRNQGQDSGPVSLEAA